MYYVYILTNKTKQSLYIGVTGNLRQRLYEHQIGKNEGFSRKYNVFELVYYEEYSEVDYAINREKQLKKWTRSKKNLLIESKNPNWNSWNDRFT